MPRRKLTTTEKLAKLEQERKAILKNRASEIAELFTTFEGLEIDNKTIIGFIDFATNTQNSDSDILKIFNNIGKKRRRPRNQLK